MSAAHGLRFLDLLDRLYAIDGPLPVDWAFRGYHAGDRRRPFEYDGATVDALFPDPGNLSDLNEYLRTTSTGTIVGTVEQAPLVQSKPLAPQRLVPADRARFGDTLKPKPKKTTKRIDWGDR